ncbi:hypothetical protein [Candidatus Marinarcus aquaticus]|uniref:Uncharacterized protein n=1 Tax=Candidatus Marinarcus aquaticus TaxID=2044504 RepID=A0A4Q0XSB4_9BACT|nr:hypothetical protein [Candidatus Marinarcus aquaticus]RXJ60296.1 hypothetical protein CRV04_04660 [Candidatus Marinarcus aquaticus]
MSYFDIFIFGWNLNAFMFVVNMLLAIRVIRSKDPEELEEENEQLQRLKEEFDSYYPNRRYETLATYLIPFTAFFRMSFRILEMLSFFSRNSGTTMYDFMVYKYVSEINRAKEQD